MTAEATVAAVLDGIVSPMLASGLSSVRTCYDGNMPRGIYKRTPEQIERIRQMGRTQGALTRMSPEGRARLIESKTTHGHGGSGGVSPTYQTWRNMLNRCNNPNVPAYRNYGARGITVAPEWHDFSRFLADMGERPEGLTIERIDNSRGYMPGNCRWATYSEQGRNTRVNRIIEFNGEALTIVEWAECTGVSRSLIAARIDRLGWSIERALTTPARIQKGGDRP